MTLKTWKVRHSRIWDFTIEAHTRAEALAVVEDKLTTIDTLFRPTTSTTATVDW